MHYPAIGKQVGISGRNVAKFLDHATEWLLQEHRRLAGSPSTVRKRSSLEASLIERFEHLKDVFVVPGGEILEAHQYEALTAKWAAMAAAFLDRRFDDAAVAGDDVNVCMSGGDTILRLVNSLPVRQRFNVTFHASALIGRSSVNGMSHVDAIANCTVGWSRSGRLAGRVLYTTLAPYDLTDRGPTYEERRQGILDEITYLLKQDYVKSYLAKLNNMDIAVAGIGIVRDPEIPGLSDTAITATNLLEHTARITAKNLEDDKVVGEIGYCYFRADGSSDEKWHFYLTAGDGRKEKEWHGVGFFRQMVNTRKDVIVMAGAFKEDAVLAALRGQLFNIWFTNEDAARRILEAAGPA
jgi:DNA-binding transcriptional regulator LsrR (DeoR family)